MTKLSCIYWFSGTGNSLYAARRLSAGLGDLPLARITEEIPADPVGGAGEIIGFVLPSYYSNLPRAARAFIERIKIKPDTYIFTVVTMGGLGQGTIAEIDSVLSAKGLRLDYGRGVHTPANYVISYNPADPDKSGKTLDKLDGALSGFADEIKTRTQKVKMIRLKANNLYKNTESLDDAFSAGDVCSGCGLCEKICPVKNIRLTNGKPEWLKHCERCMACISWCPSKAINYGGKTKDRRRYRNPRITVDEMKR